MPKKLISDISYKKLLDNMNEAVWFGDENERTVYANPKFLKMVDYTLEEVLGKESYIFWDEESAKKVRHENTTKRKKGISSSYEGNIISKKGKKTQILLNGTPLPDGGTIGIITDLTELKKREETEKILGSAIQHATDAIIVFTDKGQIQTWNKGGKIIFGYKKEEIITKKLDKIFSKEDVEKIFRRASAFSNINLQGIDKNKKKIEISATLTPINSGNTKKIKHYLLIARDISNQKKFEEELTVKYEKLREAYNKFGILRRQMDYIFDILDRISNQRDIKEIADFIVSSIIMLTQVNACVFRIYNRDKNTLDLVSFFGLSLDWSGKANINFEDSLAQKAFEMKMPIKIIDVGKEPRYQSAYLARKNDMCSLLLIPLIFQSKLVGSLSLYASAEKTLEIFENEFIEKYAKLIEIIAGTFIQRSM